MHFSVALAGFIKSQVLHFHPPCSDGGFNPAIPQLNPPLPVASPVVVVEGAAPNPVKLGLNADPVGLGVPNEKPDEVDIGGAGLDAPNRSGPEGGVGIEKVTPEPEPEEVAPGFGASQTVHFSLADAGFIKSQVPHFHPSVFVMGGLNPAAPQLNPPEPVEVVVVEVPPDPHTKGVEGGFGRENDGAAGGFSAPGFDASQTVHFSVADAGFIKSQVPHFQPPAFDAGGFSPAAPQLNTPESEVVEVEAGATVVVELAPKEKGVEGGLGMENEGEAVALATPGLGVSHTVHFSVAEAGFIKSQVPHFHPLSCFGGSKPAAPQSNPPFVVGGVAVVVVEVGGANVGVAVGKAVVVLEPALLKLEGLAGVEERVQASPMAISS